MPNKTLEIWTINYWFTLQFFESLIYIWSSYNIYYTSWRQWAKGTKVGILVNVLWSSAPGFKACLIIRPFVCYKLTIIKIIVNENGSRIWRVGSHVCRLASHTFRCYNFRAFSSISPTLCPILSTEDTWLRASALRHGNSLNCYQNSVKNLHCATDPGTE